MYRKSRMNLSFTAANPEPDYSVNESPINDSSSDAGYPSPMPPLFESYSNRFNTLDDSGNQTQSRSPCTPVGTLNILSANGSIAHSSGAGSYGTLGRASSALPFNLPLPLPLSMQSHGHFSSPFSPNGLWTTDLLGFDLMASLEATTRLDLELNPLTPD